MQRVCSTSSSFCRHSSGRRVTEHRLLKCARVVTASAEQLDARLDHIGKMSRDGVRNAPKDIVDAIEWLQTFEKLLIRKIDAA